MIAQWIIQEGESDNEEDIMKNNLIVDANILILFEVWELIIMNLFALIMYVVR